MTKTVSCTFIEVSCGNYIVLDDTLLLLMAGFTVLGDGKIFSLFSLFFQWNSY